MPNKTKFGFGKSSSVQSAIDNGILNERDLLLLDEDTDKPKFGWISKSGKPVILTDEKADLSKVEADIDILETEMLKKADAETVNAELDELNSGVAGLVADMAVCENTHTKVKFEITDVPIGTLVDYRESEIRIMCPKDTVFTKQSVGDSGNENMYYMAFKAYAPEGAVGFKEGDRGVIIDEMFDFNDDFSGTDSYGRKYSICWLAIASYDEKSDEWNYFGKTSTEDKYVGWTYIVEWYNADGIVIKTDCIRINLSNEDCHFEIKPYYVGSMMKEIDTKIEEKIAEVESAWEIIEF